MGKSSSLWSEGVLSVAIALGEVTSTQHLTSDEAVALIRGLSPTERRLVEEAASTQADAARGRAQRLLAGKILSQRMAQCSLR